LLPRDGKPIFFENRNGEFSRNDVGFDVELTIGMSASAGDYDNDGCLDVFIAQNGDWRKGIPAQGLEENTTQPDGYYEEDDGNPNFLFDGDCGSFERVTDAGIEGNHWSLVTRFVDVTGNSYPDIYVANDYNADVLYLNHGNESFKRTIVPETNRHGMSIEVGDVTGNGLPDIFVTSIYHNGSTIAQQRVPSLDTTGNNLLINQGNGTFESEEDRYGVRKGGWGWAAVLEDLNNSGTLELLHATRDFIPVTEVGNSYVWNGTTRTGPSLWTRTGDEQFERIDSAERGFIPSNSKGIASFDFNRDGKQDLVVANSNSTERFWLYENTHEANRSWIQVDVLGTETQTSIGAIVEISNGTDTWREFATDQSDFQAQDSRMLHVGLGDALVVNVTVTWPDGTERTFEDVAVNQRITVHPGNGLDGERDSERE
jgi:hypothetical protein